MDELERVKVKWLELEKHPIKYEDLGKWFWVFKRIGLLYDVDSKIIYYHTDIKDYTHYAIIGFTPLPPEGK